MSIKKNFIYNTAYNLLSITIPFITTPYISRVLGPNGVGAYSYTYSIAYYFVLFTMMGLSKYGNRTIAAIREKPDELNKLFCEIYGMQLITGIISISTYSICLIMAFKVNYTLFTIQLFYVISSVFDISWFYFGIEQFGFTVLRNTIIRIINIILLFVFIKTENDVSAYCFIMAGSTLLSQLALWPTLLKKFVKLQIPSFNGIARHFKMNLILFVPTIAVSLYKLMDKIMLGYLINETEVGYYECAEKIINIPMALIAAIGTVMLPRMSYYVANGRKEEELKYIDKTLMFTIWLSSVMSFGIMGVANIFVPLFLGNAFHKSIIIVIILAPTIIFISWGNNLCSQILIPRHRDRGYIIVVILGALVNLGLNSILIPYFLSSGAAAATFVTEFMVFIGYTLCAKCYFAWSKYIKWLLIYGFCGFTMFFIISRLQFIQINNTTIIVLRVIIGSGIYTTLTGIVTFLFKRDFFVFALEQIMWILKFKR